MSQNVSPSLTPPTEMLPPYLLPSPDSTQMVNEIPPTSVSTSRFSPYPGLPLRSPTTTPGIQPEQSPIPPALPFQLCSLTPNLMFPGLPSALPMLFPPALPTLPIVPPLLFPSALSVLMQQLFPGLGFGQGEPGAVQSPRLVRSPWKTGQNQDHVQVAPDPPSSTPSSANGDRESHQIAAAPQHIDITKALEAFLKKSVCPHCNIEFFTPALYNRHVGRPNGEKYMCRGRSCGKLFLCATLRSQHYEDVHRKRKRPKKEKTVR